MTDEIHYRGKGEHSVSELETIIEQQKEKLYQFQTEKQSAIQAEKERIAEKTNDWLMVNTSLDVEKILDLENFINLINNK
jgi:hypothetical protein